MKGAVTLGVISAAGCLGGNGGGGNGGGNGGNGGGGNGGGNGGGGKHTVTLGGTAQNSSTQQAAQALARAMSQHSDTVDLSVQVTDGWTANLYEYDAGNIPAMGVDNNSLSKAVAEKGPFADDPVDSLPQQGFMFTSLQIFWVAMEGSGIESTADLREGGYTIYPIQPGFGTRLLTEEILKEAGIWEPNEISNVDTTDISGRVEEGQIDALCVYGANGVELSSWVQEVDARSGGNLYVIKVDDEYRQVIENTPGAILEEFEPYGWNQDVSKVTDQVVSWSLAAQWAFSPDVPAEATKEIARVSSEHWETIQESDPTALDHSDPKSMTPTVMDELPVHAGVADFFEENGIWEDSWTRGDK